MKLNNEDRLSFINPLEYAIYVFQNNFCISIRVITVSINKIIMKLITTALECLFINHYL